MARPVIILLGPDRSAISGVSTHVNLLMASALREDYELVHFQVGSEGRDEGAIGRFLRLAVSPFRLLVTIGSSHADLVHINTSLNTRAYWRDLAYLLVAKLRGTRTVYQVHGGKLPHEFFEGKRVLTAFLRWTLGVPDLVAVLASAELEAYQRFAPGLAVVTLPNGIECPPFAHIRSRVRRHGEPLRMVYIGRIAREKGLYEALQATRLALVLGLDVRFTLAGAGPDEPDLRRYAVSLGIAERTTFTGPVTGSEKVSLLAGSDVMLLPSYAEGLPYALLEAMAAGVPVLATPVGAIPDVVTHGTHGYLVPTRDGEALAEALALMASDPDQLSRMSRACRQRVRADYAIERLAGELNVRYRDIITGSRTSGAGPDSSPDAASAAPAQGVKARPRLTGSED